MVRLNSSRTRARTRESLVRLKSDLLDSSLALVEVIDMRALEIGRSGRAGITSDGRGSGGPSGASVGGGGAQGHPGRPCRGDRLRDDQGGRRERRGQDLEEVVGRFFQPRPAGSVVGSSVISTGGSTGLGGG